MESFEKTNPVADNIIKAFSILFFLFIFGWTIYITFTFTEPDQPAPLPYERRVEKVITTIDGDVVDVKEYTF